MNILKDDVKEVLNTKAGRSVILQILLVAGFEKTPYVPGDANATTFHCGQQSIAKYLQGLILDADPNALPQMLKEREELHRQHEQAKQQAMAQAGMQQVKVAVK